jgi:hypothetical protein
MTKALHCAIILKKNIQTQSLNAIKAKNKKGFVVS